jgi:hypothetical protein
LVVVPGSLLGAEVLGQFLEFLQALLGVSPLRMSQYCPADIGRWYGTLSWSWPNRHSIGFGSPHTPQISVFTTATGSPRPIFNTVRLLLVS